MTVMGSVIRMVKLFGWEEKMSERIDQKRREELNAIRKLKMYSLLNSIFKFVIVVSSTFYVTDLHDLKHIYSYCDDGGHVRDLCEHLVEWHRSLAGNLTKSVSDSCDEETTFRYCNVSFYLYWRFLS